MYRLQILTPEHVFFDDDIVSLIVPGEQGYLGILTNHAPLTTSLMAEMLVITDKQQKKQYFDISHGFLEVSNNFASILVETIEPSDPEDVRVREWGKI